MALTKGKQTCLEKKGIEERKEQVSRNEWVKGYIEYTKALVSSEYTIQNEFLVSYNLKTNILYY